LKKYHTSLYTIFVSLNDGDNNYLLVHGYTGAIDHASQVVSTFLRNGGIITENDVSSGLLPFSDETFDTLVKRGYLTDKTPLEEKETVKKMAEAFHRRDSTMKNFLFLVAYDCNFRCPYCFENGISSNGKGWSKKVFTKEAVDRAYEAMLELEPNRKLHQNKITLYGGEPLLKQNKEVVDYIVREGVNLGYTFMAITNGYDLEHFSDVLKPGWVDTLQISFDGSKEKHNTRRTHYLNGGSFDKIVTNLARVLDAGVRVIVRVNTDLNNFEDLKLLKNEFERLGFFKYKTFNVYSALVHGEEEMNCNAVMAPRNNNDEAEQNNHNETKLSTNSFGFDPDQQYIDFEKEEGFYSNYPSNREIIFHDEQNDSTDQIHTMNRGQYLNKHFAGVKSDETMSLIACQDFGVRSKIKNVLEGKGLMSFRSVFCSAQTGMMILDPYGDLYNCWETVGMDKHKVGSYRNGIEIIDEELEH
jgi:uncharacterized protein